MRSLPSVRSVFQAVRGFSQRMAPSCDCRSDQLRRQFQHSSLPGKWSQLLPHAEGSLTSSHFEVGEVSTPIQY